MVSSTTMHHFPSPWRINHAGEVVRDADAEQVLHKVTSTERKSIFGSSDTDDQKNKNGKKESWLRIVRKKKDKQEENALNFQGLDNILENMECFSCGTVEDAEDGKKKKGFLTKKGGKTTDDQSSKKEATKKKKQAATSKDKSEQQTKLFQKKKPQEEEESYDIWTAMMPSSLTGAETSEDKDKKEGKDTGTKDNAPTKPVEQKSKWFQKKKPKDEKESEQKETEQYDVWAALMPASSTNQKSNEDADKDEKKPEKKPKLQWFRISRRGKEAKGEITEMPEEESKGFDFNELSAMIATLVNREAEQAEDGTKKEESKQDDTDGKDAITQRDADPDSDNSLAVWFERLKADGEGYIRFVSGSDPAESDGPNYNLDTGAPPKGEGEEVSMDGTVLSDGSETWASEYSSYEVPSLRQELKMLMTGRFGSKPKKFRTNSRAPPPQEDEKFLLRKIANDSTSRKSAESHEDNTLTLQTLNKVGTRRDHGFKVKLHEDRALCEV